MKIFISYKRENEPFARLVRENLLAWGYAVWMDIFDIPKGSYWPDEIDKGLRASDVVIGILSPQAVESRNVKNEWDWAIVNGRRLILLMHEQTYVPMNYVSLNYIPCVGSAQSNGISQLQTALQSKPSAPTAPPDPFRDYLQKLYDRINRYLGQKILATLRTDEGMPEPLRLTGESTPEAVEGLFSRQPQIDPLFAIGGIEDDPTPPDKFTDFQQAFDHFKGRVLLLGEPGAGKTITLLHTARDAVVRRLQDPFQPLPILGIIPTWDADKRQPIADWLIASDPVLRNFGEGQGVGSIIQQGRALLLLDGLDELGGERPVDPKRPDGEKFDPRQRFLDALPANNEIMVTCRRQDYAEIGSKAKLNGAITLQPLSESQIAAYLRGTAALWQAVQNDDGLREIAKTPLLLSLFAFAYHDHPEDAENLGNLAAGPRDLRYTIFERYVRERYEHEARKLKPRGEKIEFDLHMFYVELGNAAINSVSREIGDPSKFRLDSLSPSWLKELYDRAVSLDYLMAYYPMYKQLGGNYKIASRLDPEYGFVHISLRDYFAYTRSIEIVENYDNIYDFTDIRIRNAISTIGRLGDRKAIPSLSHLIEKNSLVILACRALSALPYLESAEMAAATYIRIMNTISFTPSRLVDCNAIISNLGDRGFRAPVILEAVIKALSTFHSFGEGSYPHDLFHRRIGIITAQILRDPALVPYLVPLLEDRARTTLGATRAFFNCGFAVEALRAIGTPEALSAIKKVRCRSDGDMW